MIRKLRFRMTLLVICVLIAVSAGIVISINVVNNRNVRSQVESALDALDSSNGVRPTRPSSQPSSKPGSPEEEDEDEDTEEETPEKEASEEGISDGNTPEDEASEKNSSDGETTSRKSEGGPPAKPEGDGENASPGKPGGDGEDNPPEKPEGDSGHRPSDVPDGPGSRGPGSRSSSSMSGEEVASLSNYYTITLDGDGTVESWASDREDLYDDSYMQDFADRVLALGTDSGRIGTQFFRLTDETSGQLLIVLDARLELAAAESVLMTTIFVAGIACVVLSFGAWLLIRRMVRPVEDSFRRQQQFVWDASHELKTPLAVIQANADVLENDVGENEYLGYIRSEVRRADTLVKNLLALARMDRGTTLPEFHSLDLGEAVLSVLLPFESTVYEAGKTLESDIADGVRVLGDEAMLQQLTVILLSNALKYSDEHGKISVRLSRKGRGCELRVENTGEGIGPADLPRVFDRFYRTDRSRNSETGGEGLGLAIAKSITEAHHGRIHAESEPGLGAAFIVTLPHAGN